MRDKATLDASTNRINSLLFKVKPDHAMEIRISVLYNKNIGNPSPVLLVSHVIRSDPFG